MKALIYVSIALSLLFISCRSRSVKTQHAAINFNTGRLYSDGTYRISSESDDTVLVGWWKYYYPDGKLEVARFYGDDGECEKLNIYSDGGILLKSLTIKGNITLLTEFYENGNIKREELTEKIDSEEQQDEKSLIKYYYPAGQIRRELSTYNGYEDGTCTYWDTSGNVVLSMKYNKGVIVNGKPSLR